jgi:hypothetical protein
MTEPTELMRTFPAAPGTQVTIANMQEGPFNRWAFRNLRRLLPTGNVWRGTGPATPLEVRPVLLANATFRDRDGVVLTVGEVLDEGYTDGFVVLHRGVLVAEHYGDGVEATSRIF